MSHVWTPLAASCVWFPPCVLWARGLSPGRGVGASLLLGPGTLPHVGGLHPPVRGHCARHHFLAAVSRVAVDVHLGFGGTCVSVCRGHVRSRGLAGSSRESVCNCPSSCGTVSEETVLRHVPASDVPTSWPALVTACWGRAVQGAVTWRLPGSGSHFPAPNGVGVLPASCCWDFPFYSPAGAGTGRGLRALWCRPDRNAIVALWDWSPRSLTVPDKAHGPGSPPQPQPHRCSSPESTCREPGLATRLLCPVGQGTVRCSRKVPDPRGAARQPGLCPATCVGLRVRSQAGRGRKGGGERAVPLAKFQEKEQRRGPGSCGEAPQLGP